MDGNGSHKPNDGEHPANERMVHSVCHYSQLIKFSIQFSCLQHSTHTHTLCLLLFARCQLYSFFYHYHIHEIWYVYLCLFSGHVRRNISLICHTHINSNIGFYSLSLFIISLFNHQRQISFQLMDKINSNEFCNKINWILNSWRSQDLKCCIFFWMYPFGNVPIQVNTGENSDFEIIKNELWIQCESTQ